MLPEWVFDEADRAFMAAALDQAREAGECGEVPVGAVVVCGGEIVARAGNRRQHERDPAGHAEILALREAARATNDWRLEECTLYVTLEPCPMCVAACRQARVDLVVWGAADPAMGACGSVLDLAEDPRLGPPLATRGGLAAEECGGLLKAFFSGRR
ncbi:MAG: nucleoside deaminase [Acidobacteria bacterium]|jgi:tRNA(adenine34) deaminase|nr:nucleoside deaminase [Acidobacteriota bacterium]